LQRPDARGVLFFFLRVDFVGNVSKRFSAVGFQFARYGGSCPRWVVDTAFTQPGEVRVQVTE
jgi:predicted transcriptional regulator